MPLRTSPGFVSDERFAPSFLPSFFPSLTKHGAAGSDWADKIAHHMCHIGLKQLTTDMQLAPYCAACQFF